MIPAGDQPEATVYAPFPIQSSSSTQSQWDPGASREMVTKAHPYKIRKCLHNTLGLLPNTTEISIWGKSGFSNTVSSLTEVSSDSSFLTCSGVKFRRRVLDGIMTPRPHASTKPDQAAIIAFPHKCHGSSLTIKRVARQLHILLHQDMGNRLVTTQRCNQEQESHFSGLLSPTHPCFYSLLRSFLGNNKLSCYYCS